LGASPSEFAILSQLAAVLPISQEPEIATPGEMNFCFAQRLYSTTARTPTAPHRAKSSVFF
jgi:hypothetical protein